MGEEHADFRGKAGRKGLSEDGLKLRDIFFIGGINERDFRLRAVQNAVPYGHALRWLQHAQTVIGQGVPIRFTVNLCFKRAFLSFPGEPPVVRAEYLPAASVIMLIAEPLSWCAVRINGGDGGLTQFFKGEVADVDGGVYVVHGIVHGIV